MLLHPDRFLTLADFRAYVTSQELVSQLYRPGTKRPIMSSSIQIPCVPFDLDSEMRLL